MGLRRKIVFLVCAISIFSPPSYARDGRDIALPDEYECPGCGGWAQYREDLAKQERREIEDREWKIDQQHRELMSEKRRQNELLEEQNRILRDLKQRSF